MINYADPWFKFRPRAVAQAFETWRQDLQRALAVAFAQTQHTFAAKGVEVGLPHLAGQHLSKIGCSNLRTFCCGVCLLHQ